ncbi:MAG: GNAT family N-acetyltransferase [Candidatus Sumerlaeaceae bacterium]|nr:GNAT family N-acetyltransferase [Candidatus Sumerlaeaceae bacterium]
MPAFDVRVIEPHEYDSWDHFVTASRQGSIFHTSHWCETISAAYAPARPLIVGCFENKALVGGCVALERERFGMRTAVTPLLSPYCGFVLDTSVGEKISDAISHEHAVLETISRFLIDNYSYINLVLAPHLHDIRPLQQAGYLITPRFTYQLNLRLSPEEHWQRFDGNARRQIKKAQREAFELCERLPPAEAYKLFANTFVRHGESCPVSPELFGAVVEHKALDGYREVIAAWDGDKLVGFVVLLHFSKTVYYALAANDAEYLPRGVSSLLVWEIVKQFSGREWDTFDFVGANTPSIARFKENFNPKLQLYFQVERYSSAILKLGKEVFERLRSEGWRG